MINTFERSPNAHNLRQIKRLARDPEAKLSVKLLMSAGKLVGFKFDAVKRKPTEAKADGNRP